MNKELNVGAEVDNNTKVDANSVCQPCTKPTVVGSTVKELTCTMCGVQQKHYCEIVFSKGDRVCLECKKITLPIDKIAFDRDMSFR